MTRKTKEGIIYLSGVATGLIIAGLGISQIDPEFSIFVGGTFASACLILFIKNSFMRR